MFQRCGAVPAFTILDNWPPKRSSGYDIERGGKGRFALLPIQYLFVIMPVGDFAIFKHRSGLFRCE